MNDLIALKKWYAQHTQKIHGDYFTFLRFPSISTDPIYKKDLEKTAAWLKSYLSEIGMDVQVWDTTGHPVVFATNLKAGSSRPTVLIYHHYDVQPVDPVELWKTEPFDPQVRDGKVYARGASDNKGQCFYTLTALKALRELNVNVKLFIEGEEECGSEGSTALLSVKKKELEADYLLVVDGGIPSSETPSITVGLRGILAMEVTCSNSDIDLHSGIMGGIVLNPIRALVSALAQLWDANGKITVPGFYDGIEMLSNQELEQLDQTCDTQEMTKSFGIRAFQGEGDYSLWESNTIRPVLEINGISGGYTGIGFKTVIPAKTIAKISCRLVPGQDPQKVGLLVADFLKSKVPPGIQLDVNYDHGGQPFRSSPDSAIAKIAARAYGEVFGKPCQKAICGASVPIVADLCEASGAEAVVIGLGLIDDDIHAPNEHFGLDRLEKGFLTIGRILHFLGEE